MLRFCPAALARRAIAALAICCDPAWALIESGFRGVFVPVAVEDVGATRFPGDSRKSDGSWGSCGIDPSLVRSRILTSRRLT